MMPLIVTLTPRTHQDRPDARQPVWRRLRRHALALVAPLTLLWRTLFADVRQALRASDLEEALDSPHQLDAEQVVTGLWQRWGEQEARRTLPILIGETWTDLGTTLAPEMAMLAGQPMTFLPREAAVQQASDAYVSEEVQDLWQTSLTTTRQLLRDGTRRGMRAGLLAALLAQTFGLTPRQLRRLTQAQQQMIDAGVSPAQVHHTVTQAVATGVQQRVRTIAETEAFSIVNLGQRLAMEQAAQQGGVVSLVRRTWIITDDERLCIWCEQIPDMNPDGVGLDETFSTPYGPAMQPPVHPLCRCSVEYSL